MERIGSIWTMIVRYLLLVMFGGVIVWACNSAGISVYADDGETPDGAELIRFDFHKSVNQEVGIPAGIPGFFTYFYEGKEYHYGFRFDRNGTGRWRFWRLLVCPIVSLPSRPHPSTDRADDG